MNILNKEYFLDNNLNTLNFGEKHTSFIQNKN